MKKILLLLALVATTLATQAKEPVDPKYLAGAVPEVGGVVVFTDTVAVPGKSAADIYQALRSYADDSLVHGPNHGEQARFTQDSPDEGLLVAQIEENLYFMRKALRTDYCRFYYQLIYEVKDGQYIATMRSLRYLYNFSANEDDWTPLRAEEWITDKESLTRNKQGLTRRTGKFRRCTIDRKNEIFANSAIVARG